MTLSIPETIRVLLPSGVVRKLPLEEYVRGVVAAALPADAPLEALKAQAVAARTFGAITRRHIERGSDVCTLRHCQVWKESATPSALRAAEETRGIVAVHNGRLIDAYYFEHCDGNTRDATGILAQVPPYLRSVTCPCGFATLKGHGIGMCQRGAQVMARFGDTFDMILMHYFNGIALEREGGMPTAAPEPKTAPPAQVVEPPPGPPHPIQAHKPRAPKPAVKTPKAGKTPKPPRAKTGARRSPVAPKPLESVPTSSSSKGSMPVETAESAQVVPASPATESTFPAQAPQAHEALPTPPPAVEAAQDETPTPIQVIPAPTQEQVSAAQTPKPIEAAPPPPARAVETTTPLQPQTTGMTRKPTSELEEEASWYPIAEEMVLGADGFGTQMVDEALEASAATIAPSDSGPSPILADAHTPPTPVATSSQVELPASATVEEPARLLPLPEAIPEQMPAFQVERVPVEPLPLRPPPPLIEEGLLDTLRAVRPSQVVIDCLPGPRMIVGDLAKPGIIVTIRDVDGHAVVTVSGAAPHYGPGGFEAPLASDGTYAVTFDHHSLQVNLNNETVFIQLAG